MHLHLVFAPISVDSGRMKPASVISNSGRSKITTFSRLRRSWHRAPGFIRPVVVMYLTAGALAIVNAGLPTTRSLHIDLFVALGIVDIAVGAVLLFLPWRRWPARTPLALIPFSLALIQVFAVGEALTAETYPVFFILLFIWVGVARPPRTAFYLAPIAGVAYLLPLWTGAPVGEVEGSVGLVVPVCVLIAEVIARAGRAARSAERRAAEFKGDRELANVEQRLRKQAEESLEQSRFQAALLAASPASNIVTDLDGIVTYWSPGSERLFGPVAGEAVGRHVTERISSNPEEERRVSQMVQQVFSGEPWNGEWKITSRPDGKDCWIWLSLRALHDKDGSLCGTIGTALDITQRKLIEEQLLHSQRLESVGRLAGGIAHDFNNILAGVLNYVHFVHDDLPDSDPHKADLAEVIAAGERGACLVRQLLMFSRKDESDPQILDVDEALIEVEQFVRRTIGEDIELSVTRGPSDTLVEIDPAHLHQVVMNLAVNARDAMPRGGRLILETSIQTLSRDQLIGEEPPEAGDYVCLSVSDTGEGMDRETRERIFEPFFTTKARGRGTGLGLATVFGIVRQASGRISVYSEPGFGTTFKIYLPLVSDTPAATGVEPQGEFGSTLGGRVMLVEDDQTIREVTDRVLSRAGYEVVAADGPTKAIEFYEAGVRADLVLSDVIMPGMSGPEMIAALTAIAPGFKALYMSGYTQDVISTRGLLETGELIAKPFTPDQLITKVQVVMGTSPPTSGT